MHIAYRQTGSVGEGAVCMSEWVSEWVSEWGERERWEREERERERERVCVCVCVCVWQRESEREYVCVCVWQREREREYVCVCVCVCMCECVCVCVCGWTEILAHCYYLLRGVTPSSLVMFVILFFVCAVLCVLFSFARARVCVYVYVCVCVWTDLLLSQCYGHTDRSACYLSSHKWQTLEQPVLARIL